MLTGLEVTVAKAAGTAALRAVAPANQIIRRSLDRRYLEQQLDCAPFGSDIKTLMAKLTPEAARDIDELLESPEIANFALSIATDVLIGKCGRKSNRVSEELKQQLSRLLLLKTCLNKTEADSAAALLFTAMTSAVINNISELLGDNEPVPLPVKAALLKVQESYISAAVRNSALLAQITDLARYKGFEDQLKLQIRNLYGTMRLPHAGTSRRVPYEKLYVEATVDFIEKAEPAERVVPQNLAIRQLANQALRIVLLGDPGGGKSTLSLKLAYDTASGSGVAGTTTPLLIVLREYASDFAKDRVSLIEYISKICQSPLGLHPPEGAIEYLLLNGRALVIFDGLDELLDTALRRQVVDAVTGFAFRYPTTPILVTSRRVGYADAPLDPEVFTGVSLQDFSLPQVRQYVTNWFDLDDSISPVRNADLRESFIADSEFVQDLRVNPLMLSLMCGIYSSENYIPRNRPDVYEKCALLLFEKWDKQRGINAPLSFDAHVQAAMRSLALWLYPQQASQQGLPRNKLIDFMKSYLLEKRFDDEYEAENAAAEFIDFCKGRAWVLTDIGSELYGFTHRTFLEYFAASQIVRLNPDPVKLFEYLESRLKGGGWEVVAQLALQIINKTVEDGADDFLAVLLERAKSLDDARLRSVLLAFSTQALTYIVPRPPVLRSMVQSALNMFCGQSVSTNSKPNGNTDEVGPTYMLLGASPENLPLVSKYTYDYLADKLRDNPNDEVSLSLALYPDQYSANVFLRNTSYRGTLDNVAFWTDQSRLNWTRFVNSIEPQRLSHSWVEAYMFECGHASTYEFLSRFPVRELYEITWSPEMGDGFVMALVPRIWLQFGPERHANPKSGISLDQIDQLRKALINVPTPWFTSTDPTGMAGIVDYVMDVVSTRLRNQQFNDNRSISSFLFFAATLLDLGAESVPRAPRPGGEGNSWAKELYRIVRIRQESLSGDKTVDRLAEREKLVHFGVDDLTADALARWLSDRTFCFIQHKFKRQPRASKR